MRKLTKPFVVVAGPRLGLIIRCIASYCARASCSFLLAICGLVPLLAACAHVGSFQENVPIRADLDYEPLFQPLALRIGICYGPRLRGYVLDIDGAEEDSTIENATISVFDGSINAMFLETKKMSCPGTKGYHGSDLDGVLLVDIGRHDAKLDWGIWLRNAYINLAYHIKLLAVDGTEIASWTVWGVGKWIYSDEASITVGKMVRDAIWDAASQFMLTFSETTGVKNLLAKQGISTATSSKFETPAANANGVTILPGLALYQNLIGASDYGSSNKDYGFWFEHCVQSELRKLKPSIEVLSHDEIRSLLFPRFERKYGPRTKEAISKLLAEPLVRNRLLKRGVRFAASLRVVTTRGPVEGYTLRGSSVWGFGHEYIEWKTEIDATVWDLYHQEDMSNFDGDAEGVFSLTSFLVPVPTSLARTEQKACEDISSQLVRHFERLETNRQSTDPTIN